jgi:hypothetical protein
MSPNSFILRKVSLPHEVKNYVKSVFGANSVQFKQVSNLAFKIIKNRFIETRKRRTNSSKLTPASIELAPASIERAPASIERAPASIEQPPASIE